MRAAAARPAPGRRSIAAMRRARFGLQCGESLGVTMPPRTWAGWWTRRWDPYLMFMLKVNGRTQGRLDLGHAAVDLQREHQVVDPRLHLVHHPAQVARRHSISLPGPWRSQSPAPWTVAGLPHRCRQWSRPPTPRAPTAPVDADSPGDGLAGHAEFPLDLVEDRVADRPLVPRRRPRPVDRRHVGLRLPPEHLLDEGRLLGPVPPSRPFGCDGASSAFDAPLPLAPFGDDLALPFAAGPAVASSAPPSAPLLPVSSSLDRVLLNRLSLTESSFPAALPRLG